jgi:hypothetical protein
MKNFIVLLAFLLISTVKAGTCTSISRTNSASLSVLTSTKYNTDLNTVYTAANAFDGGCITSGTLESDALNTTQFAPLLKGLQQGCKVIYSNASTVQIDKCIASVNGNFVTTTTTTNASFGCTGCSAEVASTTYYVYIQTGSTGSTLTPLILTTAPNNDGYDNTGNKVLARFYNNGSSNIDTYSIDQWHLNRFIAQNTGVIDAGTMTITGATSSPTKGTTSIDKVTWSRVGKYMNFRYDLTQTGAGSAGSGAYSFAVPSSLAIDVTTFSYTGEYASVGYGVVSPNATDHYNATVYPNTYNTLGLTNIYATGTSDIIGSAAIALSNAATRYSFWGRIPIEGWND